VPPVAFDTLAGWTGALPGTPEAVLKVVAAAHEGRPVYFELIAPWSEATQVTTRPVTLRAKVFDVSFSLLTLAFTVAGLYFARRNLRLGRGDKAGAIRLTVVVFGLILAGHLLARHLALAPGAFDRAFWESLGDSLPAGLLVGVVYLALEPYFRRRYPELLVSWTRLLSGKLRDPLVGRDHLWGVLAGLFVCLVVSLENLPPALFAAPGQTPMPVSSLTLSGLPGIAAHVLFAAADGLVRLFFITASLFLGRLVLRKAALAAAVPWLVLFVAFAGRENPLFEMPGGALCATVLVVLLFRTGLLGLAVGMGVFELLSSAPITPDLSRWFAGYGLFCLALVLAIAVYGFWAARGGAVFSGATGLDG
jgi:hypothetical protein